MKIVFTISQLGGGGAERVVALLSGEMVKLGHEVVLSTLLKEPIVYPIDSKVKLVELNCMNSRVFGTFEQIKSLRKLYKIEKPDIIISFLPVVNMTAILANIGLSSKIVISERNDPNQNPRKRILRFLRNVLYHLSDGFVFQTPDAMNYFGKYAQKKGIVIANPITGNLPAVYNGIRKKRFVSAVRLDKQKNLDMLIDAFSIISKTYSDYELVIYGDGPERTHLVEKCMNLNISDSVQLPGFSTNLHSDIIDSAAFVLSSNYEGMSNSMLEALALGIPVISTDHPIGGARMFINNRVNGLLIKVGDTEGLVEALRFAIEKPSEFQRMANKATQIRELLSVENIVKQWNDYLLGVK